MTLTHTSLRLDLKCGKGAISEGEKCTKGPATKVEPASRPSARKWGKAGSSRNLRLTSEEKQKLSAMGLFPARDALARTELELALEDMRGKRRDAGTTESRMDPRGTKVTAMEAELAKQAAARGLKGERAAAYIYGTLNKMGYKKGSKTTRKGAAKMKRSDSIWAAGFEP